MHLRESEEDGVFGSDSNEEGDVFLVDSADLEHEKFCAKCDSSISYGSSINDTTI